MATRAMQVANIAFLLDRLAADTRPNQQIRELTENALEAIERRQKAGDPVEGIIRWDVDWDNLKRTSQYKLSFVDNGDGMTSQQMLDYLNALAVQGANQTQGISQNFGVGAKITALHRNSHGLVYQSWHDGKGSMVKLHRDDKEGVYGLASFELADGPDWTPRIKDSFKPKSIDRNGTKVTLLGTSEDSNTCPKTQNFRSEAIMTVRNLTNGRTWMPADIDRALSSHALTTVMMARFHIVERVKRPLNLDLARPSKAA